MKFESQLIQASFHGKIDEIQELIKNEEVNLNEFDSKHRTALHNAVKKEHLEIIKMLIKYGAEQTSKRKIVPANFLKFAMVISSKTNKTAKRNSTKCQIS